MKINTASLLASFAAVATAKDSRTFAVLRFVGKSFLTEGSVDPILSPGQTASHLHGIMGGSNFGTTVRGDDLLSSTCTTAQIKNDKSNYWAPQVFFQSPKDGKFTKVPMMYMNVYYFFEATDDEIKAFPPGLKMVTGNATIRDAPASGGGLNLDPSAGPTQSIQWTCPRQSYAIPSYPVDSDGSKAGMVDPTNAGSGVGFPTQKCDGEYSPLRQDIHFPSCYDPEAGLDAYETNMAFPTSAPGGKQNCPVGWIHVPHIFYELYWETPQFDDQWTVDGKNQPFVLSTGDCTGYGSHGDFLAGWDEATLQTIIDTCNAGSSGMNLCPQIPGGLNTDETCTIPSPVANVVDIASTLDTLPGNNPVTGFGKGGVSSGTDSGNAGSAGSAKSGSSSLASGTTAGAAASSAPSKSTSKATSGYAGGQKEVSYTEAAGSLSADVTAEVDPTTLVPVGKPAATSSSDTSTEPSSPAEGDFSPSMYTASELKTITAYKTVTVGARPTPAVEHHEYNHGHMARHVRHGRR